MISWNTLRCILKLTWGDVIRVFDDVKGFCMCRVQWLSTTISQVPCNAVHLAHPVIRMTLTFNRKRPVNRTDTSGNAK